MTFALKKSTQFHIHELVLVTKGGNIDITKIYEEINIFDSLLTPVMTGNILIKDANGLSSKLIFDGSESLLLHISKDKDSDIASFKKAFRIYKQSDRVNDSPNSEIFVLNFVSDELMYSDQQKINQSYDLTYTEIVQKILLNYLKISKNNTGGVFDVSFGIRNVTIPNLRPLDAIEWCAKRAVDVKQAPNFMFYQNLLGYNFASLSNLLTKPDILDINFSAKNTSDSNPLSEISSARSFEVIGQTDGIEKTRSGVNAGKFVGFDPTTGTVAKKNINFGDVFSSMKHAEESPNMSAIPNRDGKDSTEMFDSKQTVSFFSAAKQFSSYIKQNAPTILSKLDNTESYLLQRKSILSTLMSKRIKLTMPGNFQLTSGFNVNVQAPNFGKKEKGGGDDNIDESLSGKYLIIATRHMIGYDKHETIIEVATTSSSVPFIPQASINQVKEVLEY
jgi:hypothetical protein